MTGGAPLTPTLPARFDELGIRIVHLYGRTETFGPAVVSEWYAEWEELPAEERATLRAHQGVQKFVSQRVRVVVGDGNDVPADGET